MEVAFIHEKYPLLHNTNTIYILHPSHNNSERNSLRCCFDIMKRRALHFRFYEFELVEKIVFIDFQKDFYKM